MPHFQLQQGYAITAKNTCARVKEIVAYGHLSIELTPSPLLS